MLETSIDLSFPYDPSLSRRGHPCSAFHSLWITSEPPRDQTKEEFGTTKENSVNNFSSKIDQKCNFVTPGKSGHTQNSGHFSPE